MENKEREKDPKRTDLFRFNDKKGEWKKLSIQFTDDGCFFTMEEGRKGSKDSIKKLSIKLSAQEITFLSMVLEKGFLKFIK